MATKQQLAKLISAEQSEHLALLQKLIRTPSSNPPGDTTSAIEVMRHFLDEREIETEVIAPKAHAPNLVSILFPESGSTGERNLVLNGHIDQFPVIDSEQWRKDPYSGDVEGGFVHGRGGVDMKAGTATSIITFTYLHRFRSQLKGQCVLEVVSDEETGGKFGTRYLLEGDKHKDTWRGNVVLNAEPSGIESIRFGEKGTLRLTFTVECLGTHGAYIHRSEGAIRIASRLIARLVELEDLRGQGMDPALKDHLSRKDVQDVANRIMGSGAAASMLRPTVNVGTIKGGAKVNMIPASCVFEADIRLPIGLKAAAVLEQIDSILTEFGPQVTYSVQDAASNPAAASSFEHEMVEHIQSNARMVGKVNPLPIASLGATDCKHFRYHGVPAYSYGPSPATMAERDEKVSVEEFLHLVKVHTLAAWDYLHGGD